jgi:hypothetical protein
MPIDILHRLIMHLLTKTATSGDSRGYERMTENIGAQVEYDAEPCAGMLANSETANESSISCNQQTFIVFRIGERQQMLPLAPPSRYIRKSR